MEVPRGALHPRAQAIRTLLPIVKELKAIKTLNDVFPQNFHPDNLIIRLVKGLCSREPKCQVSYRL